MINIHPAVVHFPIALLAVYAFLELISWGRLKSSQSLIKAKIILLISGIIGAFISLQTGELAERSSYALTQASLVEVHSFWAGFSTWIFGIIAAMYLIVLVYPMIIEKIPRKTEKFTNWIYSLSERLTGSIIIKLLALIGLIAILITGALGGAIVYGPDVDPIVSWIYHLFF